MEQTSALPCLSEIKEIERKIQHGRARVKQQTEEQARIYHEQAIIRMEDWKKEEQKLVYDFFRVKPLQAGDVCFEF